MKRLFSGLLIGGSVTFLLFVFMAFLVQIKAEFKPAEEYIQVDLGNVKPESALESKKRTPPRKPPPPKKPPPPEKIIVQDDNKIVNNLNFQMSSLNVDLKGDGPFLGKGGAMNDGEAIPLMITEPRWPRKALMEGIEGYVRLCFDIQPDGKAIDVKVVDSNPRRLFDRTAQRAVYKWKFKPQVVDGVAVLQKNMCYTMEFKLEQG